LGGIWKEFFNEDAMFISWWPVVASVAISSIFYCLIKQWRKKMQMHAVDFAHVPEE